MPSAYQSKVDQVFTKVPVVEIQLSTVRVMEATGRVLGAKQVGSC